MLATRAIEGQRFICREDTRGRWTVWDRCEDGVASLGNVELTGLRHDRALAAFSVLERIYAGHRDASSFQRRDQALQGSL